MSRPLPAKRSEESNSIRRRELYRSVCNIPNPVPHVPLSFFYLYSLSIENELLLKKERMKTKTPRSRGKTAHHPSRGPSNPQPLKQAKPIETGQNHENHPKCYHVTFMSFRVNLSLLHRSLRSVIRPPETPQQPPETQVFHLFYSGDQSSGSGSR